MQHIYTYICVCILMYMDNYVYIHIHLHMFENKYISKCIMQHIRDYYHMQHSNIKQPLLVIPCFGAATKTATTSSWPRSLQVCMSVCVCGCVCT